MNFFVLTLFPDMITDTLSHSITGRAIKEGKINIEAVNIRDFANNKQKHVDDYPYGGGAGMVMQPQPIYDAYKSIEQKAGKNNRTCDRDPRRNTVNYIRSCGTAVFRAVLRLGI